MQTSLNFRLLCLFAAPLFLFSCLNEETEDNHTGGPDPLAWDYEIRWKEIETRIATDEWEPIHGGDTLTIAFTYTDTSRKELTGIYGYNSINLNVALEEFGHIDMGEDSISFIFPLATDMPKDTIRLPVQLTQEGDDRLLIIRNTFESPAREVKYKKVGFKEY